jgi:CheY-like chemotaxis protein
MKSKPWATAKRRWTRHSAGRPDLILSDVMMLRLDGFGLLRAVRADPALSAVPVVLAVGAGRRGGEYRGNRGRR